MKIDEKSELSIHIRDIIEKIICKRVDILTLACSQRSKFEGWLKFELASELICTYKDSVISIEPPYFSGGRADLSFQIQNQKWFIELKTSNTNWRAEGIVNKTRPITRNINYISKDIQKLREKSFPFKGLMAFVLFPIPTRILQIEREKLNLYLSRIETKCSLPVYCLINQSSFIEISPMYSVSIFVIET